MPRDHGLHGRQQHRLRGLAHGRCAFKISNFESLQGSGNWCFSDLGGGALTGAGFDWGIPFYLGRRVVVGFEARRSNLGAGPLVAY